MPVHLRTLVLVMLVTGLVLWTMPIAGAVPTEQQLEEQIDDAAAAQEQLEGDLGGAQSELAALEADFQLVVDDYNLVNEELDALEREIAGTEADVARYRDATASARDQVGRSARNLYKSGISGGIAGLIGGMNSSEFVRRLTFIEAARSSRLEAVERYAADADRYEAGLERLESAHAEADAKRDELADLRSEIETRVESQRDDIARLEAEISRQADVRAEREARLATVRAERAREEAATRSRQGPTAGSSASTAVAESSSSGGGAAPAAAPAQGSSSKAAIAVRTALAQVGKPYQWGGSGPNSFDCSGLTSYAWRAAGVSLPHNSGAQYSATTRVSQSELQPGDLLFFYSPISHVGMYIGDGKMVDAPYSGQTVRVRSIFRGNFVGAGRPRY